MTTLKIILFDKFQNSAFDGAAKILRSNRPIMKLFWSLILMILLATCSFYVINAIFNYLAYEIVTTITLKKEIPAKMPTIMLCNSNSLMTNMGIHLAASVYSLYGIPKINNYLNFSHNQVQFPRMINNKGNILLPRTMVMTYTRSPQVSDALRKSLGLTIEEMLISCTFNSMECSANDFSWFYDTYFGNCFKFNATGRDKISQSGKYNGLNMEIFVGKASTVEQVAKNNGIHIFIFNETVTTNPFSDGIDVSVGKQTNLLLNKNRVIRKQKPYGKCTPDLTSKMSYPSELYQLTYEIYKNYRQKGFYLNNCFNSLNTGDFVTLKLSRSETNHKGLKLAEFAKVSE